MTSWPAANGVRWVKPSIARESPSWTTTATPSASDTISAIGQQVPLDLAVADGLGPAVGRVVDGGELRGGAHGGVDLPVPVVAADSLDDLEEQPVAEHAGVEVEQLAAGLVAVVQDAERSHGLQQRRVQLPAGVQVLVVVRWDRQDRQRPLPHATPVREDVAAAEGTRRGRGRARQVAAEGGDVRARRILPPA